MKRFIAILLLIGVVIVKWDTFMAYYARWTRPGEQMWGWHRFDKNPVVWPISL